MEFLRKEPYISKRAIEKMENIAQIEFDSLKEIYKDIDEGMMQDMFERILAVGYENGAWDKMDEMLPSIS